MITDDIKKNLTIISDDQVTITAMFTFTGTETILRDHFPQTPIIPGVYLIGLCRSALAECGKPPVTGLERAKFMKICLPGIQYLLKITLSPALATCSIYAPEQQLCAKIVLPLQG